MTNQRPRPILGIDPGLTGAVAVLQLSPQLKVIDVIDIVANFDKKEVMKKGKKTTKKVVTLNREKTAKSLIAMVKKYRPVVGYIEKVHAFPEQGVSSTFKFGHTTGFIEGVLIGAGISLIGVSPALWRPMGIGVGEDKDAAIGKALTTFYGSDRFLTKKSHHNRAEAMFIGYIGTSCEV